MLLRDYLCKFFKYFIYRKRDEEWKKSLSNFNKKKEFILCKFDHPLENLLENFLESILMYSTENSFLSQWVGEKKNFFMTFCLREYLWNVNIYVFWGEIMW